MNKDPYRYFRIEARELLEGLGQGLLRAEKGTFDVEVVVHMLRLAHTLKGAARVVKQQRIAEVAHALESALTPARESGTQLTREQTSELLRMLDEVRDQLAELEPAAAPQAVAGKQQVPVASEATTPLDTLRVDVAELEKMLRGISEAAVKLATFRRNLDQLAHAQALSATLMGVLERGAHTEPAGGARTLPSAKRNLVDELHSVLESVRTGFDANVESLERELEQLREQAQQMRLLPVSTLFSALERAVRDAAESENKSVEFRSVGGEIKVDAHVLSVLNEALLHVARNAVSHGIETSAERSAAGKPAQGIVSLEVQRRGRRVSISCHDDGRGVDAAAVRRAAVARGLVTQAEAEALSTDEATRLILRQGLTTQRTVTQVSGRGVGMDVVRSAALRLKGEVVIRSEPGRGTTMEVVVPLSVSSTLALAVDAAGMNVLLPLDAIQRTLRIVEQDIARTAEGDSVLSEGQVLPFVPLAQALGRNEGRRPTAWSAVVVQAGARAVAVGVDRLMASSQIVVRPLPKWVDAMPLVTGVAVDGEGNPQLVLDPAGLVEHCTASAGAPQAKAPILHRPILVVDDSLTTRMLEHSILETAGYEVDLAASAEEALEKALVRRYALFVVDVEMPGMDGFQFVETTQRTPALRDIPAVLVTSRSAPEDLQRGQQAGAKGYIIKGQFNQDHLLNTIRRLLGTQDADAMPIESSVRS
jgi:two-component system, chemotaxis family, sensor kinase CheA